jgi:hypothetical protein
MNQSTNQSANRPANQSISQSIRGGSGLTNLELNLYLSPARARHYLVIKLFKPGQAQGGSVEPERGNSRPDPPLPTI